MKKIEFETINEILDVKHMQALTHLSTINIKMQESISRVQSMSERKLVAWEAMQRGDPVCFSSILKFIAFMDEKQSLEVDRQSDLHAALQDAKAKLKSVLHAHAIILEEAE